MDQLASMRPFDEPEGGKKFSLGCMLVERKGTDSDGNERGILVTTSVDPPGTLGIAGVQKGDAVLALNGSDVENYQDLKREMGKIHAAGRMTVDITIQRQAVGVPEILTVSS
jgi:S1-C subfamily serine protease